MSTPKGFTPFFRSAHASAMAVTINELTGHLMFNALAKRNLLSALTTEHTREVSFYYDEDTNRLFISPAKADERGWKLNANNGMISAAAVRDWMLDHGYEPGTAYSLIPQGRGWIIEPAITLPMVQAANEPVHVHRSRRTPAVDDTREELHATAAD